jgi:DNA-binding beta-propeller fold protein YncE
MRKIHVRASVAAFVLFFVLTLHSLQLDGQNLNRPSGRGKLRSCCPPAPKFYTATKPFAIGKEPRGIAFDGANLWVANRDDNNLTELRASDGVVVRTVAVRRARWCDFDGANIWVVNQGYNLKVDGSVTKLNSANGATLGIFPVGPQHSGVRWRQYLGR